MSEISPESSLIPNLHHEILLQDPRSLRPHPRNARTHQKKQIEQIANSIKAFGFTNPILTDGKSKIIAGHGRVLAAIQLGIEKVPTLCLDYLSDDEIRAYVIADNKLALNAGWDEEILAIELQYLTTLDLDFTVEITGFETTEIDLLIGGIQENSEALEDMTPELSPETPSVCKPGDIWQLGNHRLVCGNALKEETYHALMGEERADMVFTDPPYNVPIAGHVSGLGKVKHKDFAMACGEMSESEFTSFLQTFLTHTTAFSGDGSLHYLCMDWRHATEILAAGKAVYNELKNICVWNKDNGGMGSMYRSKHEFVFVFKHGTKPHRNNVELGKYGRYRTNVWDYAGVNTMRKDRMDELAMHPTVKPVAMIADAILDCTKRNDIVLDPFAGSGSTIIAAERIGRTARVIELDPHYCDVILRRWQDYTGKQAVNASTGAPYAPNGGQHE